MLRATYQFLARRSTLFGLGGLLVLWAFPVVSYGFMSTIQQVLLDFVTIVFGWLVWAGAMLLNYTINEFVIGFGRFFIDSGLGNTVDALWVIVRDIFNLGFIFGLVYIGLRMIFDSNDSNAKKLLIMLILAALLVNFSLFFSKTIIDVANYTAAQIASVFPQPDPNSPNVEVAGAFSVRMGLNIMFSINTRFPNVPQGAAFGYIIGTLILYIVAAFVFFSGAFMLLVRFAVLNLYLIFSPLMFAGWVFPGAAKVTSDYWSGFLGRAFFAPAYLLMLYFSYRILDAFAIRGGSLGELFGDSTVAASTFASVVPPFALTCIFLIASLVVAQKMGAQGATASLGLGKSISNKAKQYTKKAAVTSARAAAYLPAAGARKYVVNPLGTGLEKKLNEFQTRGGMVGKVASFNVTDRLVRGKAQTMAKAQLGTGTTNDAEEAYQRGIKARAVQTNKEQQRARDLKVAENVIDPKTGMALPAAALVTALEDLGKIMKDMSKEEKLDLGINKLTDHRYAVHVTDDDIKHFESSGKFSAQEIQNIKTARSNGFKSIATHGNTLTTLNAAGTVTGYSHANANDPSADRRQNLVSGGVKYAGKLPVDILKRPEM